MQILPMSFDKGSSDEERVVSESKSFTLEQHEAAATNKIETPAKTEQANICNSKKLDISVMCII